MKYEIWLGGDYTHFDHGKAHLDDGSAVDLMSYCNISIARDSIIIGVPTEFYVPDDSIRWYPAPGVIELCAIHDGLSILFHNATDYDIYIYGYAYLKPGDSIELDSQTPEKHKFLSRWEPVGLGRLVATSNSEFQEFVGEYGLIVQRICFDRKPKRDFGKSYTRFWMASALLSDDDDDDAGFETTPGELTYSKKGEAVLWTKNNRYIYKYDKGDGNNE